MTVPPAALTPGELVAVNAQFGALRRLVDAAHAPVAAEIARQSRVELGGDSLAKRQGFRSPVSLISTTTGASVGDAIRLVQVGEATAPRMSLTGETLPAKHPHVAAAVDAGRLGMPAASAIITLLDRVACRVDPGRLDTAEQELVSLAPGMRPDELNRLLTRAEAHLDPDGIAPRHEQARTERALTIRKSDGRIELTGVFDIATGAPIITAIEGIVTQVLRRNEHADDAERDQRSLRQMQADALHDLCRHALGCDHTPTGPTTTVIVRMDLDALRSGVGTASIDGIDTPLPAAAVRHLAADLQIIPAVLGGASEILDWGRAKRLFTTPQKLALTERDGGCAGCGAPPGWCIAHHINWWDRDTGPTNLDNGILLCTACHHRIHDDGWDIHITGTGTTANVSLIPPPWIDPTRTPRPGGLHHYTLTA